MCEKAEQVCAAHTAGPWFVSEEDGEVYSMSEYTSVAMVLMNGHGPANGRMIAAAPEMLDAIKAELSDLQDDIRWADGGELERLMMRMDRLMAVLSKAEALI